MKSELNCNTPPITHKFPLLAKLKQTKLTPTSHGTVVLFTGPNTGTVVHTPPHVTAFVVGDVSRGNLSNVMNFDIWEILPRGATVTLTQE